MPSVVFLPLRAYLEKQIVVSSLGQQLGGRCGTRVSRGCVEHYSLVWEEGRLDYIHTQHLLFKRVCSGMVHRSSEVRYQRYPSVELATAKDACSINVAHCDERRQRHAIFACGIMVIVPSNVQRRVYWKYVHTRALSTANGVVDAATILG